MSAGKLRHRIVIEERDPSGDGFNWQTWATTDAEKRPMSAREFMGANQVLANAAGAFVIRWRAGVLPTMRIRIGTDIYNILGVLEDKESGREWLTLPYGIGTNEG